VVAGSIPVALAMRKKSVLDEIKLAIRTLPDAQRERLVAWLAGLRKTRKNNGQPLTAVPPDGYNQDKMIATLAKQRAGSREQGAARSIGQKIKQFRKERGLTLAELAKQSKVHLITIHHIEKGHQEPTSSTIHSLADALGVDDADLEPAA